MQSSIELILLSYSIAFNVSLDYESLNFSMIVSYYLVY